MLRTTDAAFSGGRPIGLPPFFMPETTTTEPVASGPPSTGTPGKRTRSEVARLAALARWGKYKGKGKPAPKGRKPKTTAEEKEAKKRQEAAVNRTRVAEELGMSSDEMGALGTFAAGGALEAAHARALFDKGLIETDDNGDYRATPAGRQFYNAAGRGEVGQARDVLSRGTDTAGRARTREQDRVKKEQEAADKEAEKKPKGGGGGGGKPKDKPKEDTAARAKTAQDTAATLPAAERIKPADVTALRTAQDAGGAESAELRRLGLIDANGTATDQGRRALSALERGNVGGYRAAVQDAQARLGREGAARERRTEKERRDAERAANTAERRKEREVQVRADERRKLLRQMGETNKGLNMDLEDTLTALTDIVAGLDDPDAIKAGRRHSASDQAMLDAICEAASRIHELAQELGASPMTDLAEEDADVKALPPAELPEDGYSKGIEIVSDDLAVLPGSGVKAIGNGDGWTGGYLVRFGGDGDLSDWRDVFDTSTDFGSHAKTDVWVHHRMLPGLGKRKLTNQADIGMDDEGVFIKHLLDLRSSYERKLYGMVQADKLGWSSGTAPHLVERKTLGDGRHTITQWPLGLDASYTPMPAGGLGVEARATALKSLLADAGIDLLHAIYDSPEADGPETVQVAGVTKTAQDDRARRLAMELELIKILEVTWTL